MAIKAEEMDIFTPEDKQQADKLERIIDSVLLASRSDNKRAKKISFTVNNDSYAPNASVQKEIERRYQAAGWESARFHHSYVRGYGDFWCLSITLTRKTQG
jgi:hypothetical protein